MNERYDTLLLHGVKDVEVGPKEKNTIPNTQHSYTTKRVVLAYSDGSKMEIICFFDEESAENE